MQVSHVIAVGALLLATRVWFDTCEMIKQSIRMNSYVKISSCALDILKIIQEESKYRRKL